MAVPVLTKAIELARDFGFFDTVIPFLLIFTLVYAIIRFTGILGKDDQVKNANAIAAVIAFSIAFLVIATTNVVKAINSIVPHTAILLVIALMAMLLLGLAGFKTQDFMGENSKASKWIAGILMVIFVGVLLYSFGWNILEQFSINPDFAKSIFTAKFYELLLGFGLLIGIPVLVVYFITKQKKGDK